MRRVRVALTIALAAGTALTAAASPRQEGAASSDVKVVDRALYAAIAARDAAQVADILDDGFMLTSTFGVVYDKKGFLAGCCTPDPAAKTMFFGATESQIRERDNTVVILARTEMRFVRDTEDRKIVYRSMRVYVKSGKTWKLVAEQRTALS